MPEQQETKQESVTQSPEWMLRRQIEAEVRVALRQEYESLYKLWQNGDLAELKKENEKTIEDGLQKLFDKWKEEQKPPTHEQIQELLNQEYETFTVKVETDEASGRVFTIRELPQAAEIKFYKGFKEKILAKASLLAAFAQESIDRPFEERAKAMLELVGEGFDALAESVLIVLNPFGTNDITREWVQANISSDRQWRIVEAQVQVNRLKDFFSKVSQSGQTSLMMSNQRFPQLQQLARS